LGRVPHRTTDPQCQPNWRWQELYSRPDIFGAFLPAQTISKKVTMNTRNENPGVGPTTTGECSEPATSLTTARSDGIESRVDLVVKQQTRPNPAELVPVAGGTICGRDFPSLTKWTENGDSRADVITDLQPRGGESTEVISFGTTIYLSGTQAAIYDCATVLRSGVVLLAGTVPVGQWYTKVYPQTSAYLTGPDEQIIQQPGAHDRHAADAILMALD